MLGAVGDSVPDDGVAATNLRAEDLNVANVKIRASVEATRNAGRTKRMEVKWRNWAYMNQAPFKNRNTRGHLELRKQCLRDS
jgi:hypothetical protein